MQKTLRNSHIIPEFFYRATYDEKHRLSEMNTDPGVPNKCFRQKGIREHLLCGECEVRLAKVEKYAREFLYGRLEVGILPRGRVVEVSNLDYGLFRIFLLSVLWRAGIASDPFFSAVSLGKRHEERLRKMVHTGDPGEPYEYGCGLTFVKPGELPVTTLDGLILKPERLRNHGHTTYRFVFGSIVWIFFVSSHTNTIRAGSYFFIGRNGVLRVGIRRFEELPFLRGLAIELAESGKL
jgi:hypothetical protein